MKLRLTPVVLAALISACATSAQAGYFSPATITQEGEMVLGSSTDGGYTIDAKDGKGNATITVTVVSGSALYVRDGQLTVGGTNTPNTVTLMPSPGGQLAGTKCGPTILSVAGNNAQMVIDKATVTSNLEASSSVGGADGNGTLTIQNGGKYLGGNKVSFFVGYKSYDLPGESPNQVNVHATTQGTTYTPTGDTSNLDNRYQGTYTDGLDGTKFGKGVVTVTGEGSELITGYGGFYMAEGIVTVENKASLTTGTYTAQLGLQNGSTSVINVTGDATMTFGGALQTGVAESSRSYINVDSAELNLKNVELGKGSQKDGVYQDNGSETEMKLTGSAKVNASDISVGQAAAADISVGAGSTLVGNVLTTGNKGTVSNAGKVNMDVDMKGGSFSNSGNLTAQNSINVGAGSTFEVVGDQSSITAPTMTVAEGGELKVTANVPASGNTEPLVKGNIQSLVMNGSLTLNLSSGENLHAGSSFTIFSADSYDWNPSEMNVIGTDAEAVWENGNLVITLTDQLIVTIDPLADAVQAANWGVYKSSQAFTGILWAPHTNAVSLTLEDEKAHRPTGQSVAWASAYSQFSEIGGSRGFRNYDYSIYGGAVGVEHRFASGRIIGAALGYDWGKATPAGLNNVNQNTLHGALYGCAGKWNVSQKGSIRADWSVAAGTTESEHKLSDTDWSQDSLQLDVRATYTHQLNNRTAVSGFVGMQYYAQSDDHTARIKADSLQNLRMMMGAGVSHTIGRTTVFGELAIHNDTMRHNPSVEVDGFRYGSGSNPGRLGGSISVGAEYRVNDDWSLRGNYSFEGADDHTQHSLNAGAVYSF